MSELDKFLSLLESSINNYDNELKHTVNRKREYVFKEHFIVGQSVYVFKEESINIVDENKDTFFKCIEQFDIAFPNIITDYTDGTFKFVLLNKSVLELILDYRKDRDLVKDIWTYKDKFEFTTFEDFKNGINQLEKEKN